jgi:predicted nucleic acid-binding protein
MARMVVLDAGPTGDASNAPSNPGGVRCRQWIRALVVAGTEIIVPAIADYETRRELVRRGSAGSIVRLDELRSLYTFLPITDAALRRAADFWAIVRNIGQPTAHPHALDADAILAAQATLCGGPGDEVLIATTNVGHLNRFPGVDARQWDTIS